MLFHWLETGGEMVPVAIGYNAAYSDTAAEGIVAIGRAALYYNNGKSGKCSHRR